VGIGDYALIEDLFSHRAWRPTCCHDFVCVDGISALPADADGAVIVLPARHHADIQYVTRLNADIAKLRWVVLMLIGDEESAFPTERIEHPNIRIWVQMLRPGLHPFVQHPLVNGYTPHVRLLDDTPCPAKPIDWFFSGQITHPRREQCLDGLNGLPNGRLLPTAGFTEGLPPAEFMAALASAKIAPAPSGPVSPDSFRFAEALEAGCVPLADAQTSPAGFPDGYWQHILGDDDLPFPIIPDWSTLPEVMSRELAAWPANANRCGMWWMSHKRRIAYDLDYDLRQLRGGSPEPQYLDDQITALVVTSPALGHPSTAIIEQTIASIRFHFPLCEVLILADGVRPECEPLRPAYEEFKRRLVWLCMHKWRNVIPLIFEEHLHQAVMTRIALINGRWVNTPLILFCEDDTPIVTTNQYECYDGHVANTERQIEWAGIFAAILNGDAHVVRLYHRGGGIPRVHKWLMVDDAPRLMHGVNLWRTRQWCQRPHVADANYYREILSNYFSHQARTFLEDRLATIMQNRKVPWEKNKLWVYWPSNAEAQRSYHLDRRYHEGKWQDKYEEKLVY
jgi:hypothetical protein